MVNNTFTYLIGAGSSANTLPTVKDIPTKLNDYLSTLKKPDYDYGGEFFPENVLLKQVMMEGYMKSLTKGLAELIEACKTHSSIDTYARKLYLLQDLEKYKVVKFIFNEFLIYEQIINGVDLRYETFLASILNLNPDKKLILPDNIRILSWNYDNQFELAYAKYLKEPTTVEINRALQNFPETNYDQFDVNRFGIYKFNGTAGGAITNGTFSPLIYDYNLLSFKTLSRNIVSNMLLRYYFLLEKPKVKARGIPDDKYPTIFFSWDNDVLFDKLRSNALKAIQNTKYLIIIGYSFPTFNRQQDREVLKNMKNLQRIYLQTTKNSIDSVCYRLQSLIENDIKIEKIDATDEFFIPLEF